jgi:hypothetical protein
MIEELDRERKFNRVFSRLINRILGTNTNIIKVRWHKEQKDTVEVMHAHLVDGRFEEEPWLVRVRVGPEASGKDCHSFPMLESLVESIKKETLS